MKFNKNISVITTILSVLLAIMMINQTYQIKLNNNFLSQEQLTASLKDDLEDEFDDITQQKPVESQNSPQKALRKEEPHPEEKGEAKGEKKEEKGEAKEAISMEALNEKWKKLFTVNRDVVECHEVKVQDENDYAPKIDRKRLELLANPPIRAKDIYGKKKIGFGNSAYLFDYLDATLREPILKEFSEMWKAAVGIIPKDEKYEDSYALATILLGKPRKMFEIKGNENKEMLERMSRVLPDFNQAIWMKSLDSFKINALIKEWVWHVPTGTDDPAKYLINKFDFNADGRLNIKEFLIASIVNNKNIMGSDNCKFCFSDIIKNLIDPIFRYADCDDDFRISSEELWKGLKLFKKDQKYSYYKCIIDNGNFRTGAVNDFILKASNVEKGSLDKSDFRAGILTGFWGRHVNEYNVEDNDTINKKDERWPGGRDIDCEEMELNFKVAKAEGVKNRNKK